eukprot:m.13662 g.13662  ORF g.13662 m.13662 type:complete len:354 (-) comp3318_c0_seq1:352-1413(-)
MGGRSRFPANLDGSQRRAIYSESAAFSHIRVLRVICGGSVGTGRPRSCSATATTPRPSTCGVWAASSPSSSRGDPSCRVVLWTPKTSQRMILTSTLRSASSVGLPRPTTTQTLTTFARRTNPRSLSRVQATRDVCASVSKRLFGSTVRVELPLSTICSSWIQVSGPAQAQLSTTIFYGVIQAHVSLIRSRSCLATATSGKFPPKPRVTMPPASVILCSSNRPLEVWQCRACQVAAVLSQVVPATWVACLSGTTSSSSTVALNSDIHTATLVAKDDLTHTASVTMDTKVTRATRATSPTRPTLVTVLMRPARQCRFQAASPLAARGTGLRPMGSHAPSLTCACSTRKHSSLFLT